MIALSLLPLLSIVLGLVSLGCFIWVEIQLFQNDQVLHGVIGIVTCGLWAFIWGWVRSRGLGLTQVMAVWTIAVVVGFAIRVAIGA